jgi:hypothetical protein
MEAEGNTDNKAGPASKAERKAFALRLNASLLGALERWAQDEFRSTNGQIEYLLQEALKKAGRKIDN